MTLYENRNTHFHFISLVVRSRVFGPLEGPRGPLLPRPFHVSLCSRGHSWWPRTVSWTPGPTFYLLVLFKNMCWGEAGDKEKKKKKERKATSQLSGEFRKPCTRPKAFLKPSPVLCFLLAGNGGIISSLQRSFCKIRSGRCALLSCLPKEEKIGTCSLGGRKCCRKKK